MRNIKLFMVIALAIVFTFTMIGLADAAAEKCPLCGMKMAGNENTAYEIEKRDGTTKTFCCAHCGLWANAKRKAHIKSAKARDFISGEWDDASNMVYLFKSSAVPACAPGWIAFSSREEAEKFQKGFGGTIYTFEEALIERPKHPKGMMMKGMKMEHMMEHKMK